MDELRRRVRRGLRIGMTAANCTGCIATYVFIEIALVDPTALEPGGERFGLGVTLLLATLVIGTAMGWTFGALLSKGWWRPMGDGVMPDQRQRRAILAQPGRLALACLGEWLVGAVIWAWLMVWLFDGTGAQALHIFDLIVFGGLTTAGIVYLVTERVLRPVFVLALADEFPSRPATLGVRPRLLLAWALGSGVPLVGLVVAPIVIEAPDWELPVSVLGGLGLMAGALMTAFAARSVAEPLDEVRHGLAAVQRGDLGVALQVDDAGEVGMLQAGFNRMVDGLRERQRLQDLFGRQVGEQVARLAIEHGVDLEGEQVEASVLFVDLVGSTALAQDRPAPTVFDLLNRLFACVNRVVTEDGGYISRFEGDGALCVFGVPVPVQDHATRALRAARRLAAALADEGIVAGVGASSGIIVAGNVGTPERYEYTVIGDPVNEAARLTDEAKKRPGRVLAGEAAVARADHEALEWSRGGELLLRGRSAPTAVFEPLALAQSTAQ